MAFLTVADTGIVSIDGPAAEVNHDGNRKKDNGLDHDIDQAVPRQPVHDGPKKVGKNEK